MSSPLNLEDTTAVADGPELDPITDARLLLALDSAETLRELTAGSAWSALDPVLADEMRSQSRRLADFLERAETAPGVRDFRHERQTLHEARRALSLATVVTGGEEAPQETEPTTEEPVSARREHFLGNFSTESEKIKTARREAARRRAEERAAQERRTRRRRFGLRAGAYVLVGAAAIAASVILAPALREKRVATPAVPYQRNAHLALVQAHLPATATRVKDDGANIVVDRAWLELPLEERQDAARGVQQALADEGVSRLVFAWDNGEMIGFGQPGAPVELEY